MLSFEETIKLLRSYICKYVAKQNACGFVEICFFEAETRKYFSEEEQFLRVAPASSASLPILTPAGRAFTAKKGKIVLFVGVDMRLRLRLAGGELFLTVPPVLSRCGIPPGVNFRRDRIFHLRRISLWLKWFAKPILPWISAAVGSSSEAKRNWY